MDIFAYTTFGIIALLVLCWIVVILIDLVKDPIGQAILIGGAFIILALCAVVSAFWLVGTKLI